MAFGHNTNATFHNTTYHVQTEDRGAEHPFVDTTVYFKGQVLHRRTHSYQDLLPLSPENEKTLGGRLDAQHFAVVEEIRSGALRLAAAGGARVSQSPPAEKPALVRREIEVELLNPRSWLEGNRAHLEVAVREKGAGKIVAGARVAARIEGAASPFETTAETGADGRALVAFEMPRLAGGDAALVVEARQGIENAHLKFQLKAKPKVPSPAGAR